MTETKEEKKVPEEAKKEEPEAAPEVEPTEEVEPESEETTEETVEETYDETPAEEEPEVPTEEVEIVEPKAKRCPVHKTAEMKFVGSRLTNKGEKDVFECPVDRKTYAE